MVLKNTKLFIGILIFLAYISIGVFGLFQFSHAVEMPMSNCPYADNGSALCENSMAHINNWHQFSNITISSLFVFSFLILGIILYLSNKPNLLNQNKYFYTWKYYLNDHNLFTLKERFIKWLSLFENSPPVSVVFFY